MVFLCLASYKGGLNRRQIRNQKLVKGSLDGLLGPPEVCLFITFGSRRWVGGLGKASATLRL